MLKKKNKQRFSISILCNINILPGIRYDKNKKFNNNFK